jgi:hypothetical protein
MTIDEFQQLAQTWGGDIARWPPHRRTEAEAIARMPAEAVILEEARRLDRLIAASAPAIATNRIDRATLGVAMAVAADGARPAAPRLARPRLARPRLARRWLVPAASIACAAVVGVSLGVTYPLSSLRRAADSEPRSACLEDHKKFCQNVRPGKGAIKQCLLAQQDKISSDCKIALEKS